MKRNGTTITTLILALVAAIHILGTNTLGTVNASDSGSGGTLKLGTNGVGNIYTALAPGGNVLGMKFGNIEDLDISKLFKLSDDDKIALLEGKNIDLILSASYQLDNERTSDLDLSAIQNALLNSSIRDKSPLMISYMDISLYKEVRGKPDTRTIIEETNVPVNFTMEPPLTIGNPEDGYRRYYYFFSAHNGKVSMDGPFFSDGYYIPFSLQRFSTFALTYVDLPIEDLPRESNQYVPYNKPQTTADAIRQKVNSMVSSSAQNPVEPSEFTSEDAERVMEPEAEEEPVEQFTYKENNSVSPFKLIVGLIVIDLILVCGYTIYTSNHRNKKKK